MPRDAVAQLEGPLRAVIIGRPLRCERGRSDVAVRSETDQVLEALRQHAVGAEIQHVERIEP